MRLYFLAALLMIASPAYAETQTYNDTGAYETEAAQEHDQAVEREQDKAGRIVPTRVQVSLVPRGNSKETVGLHFSVPDVVNGCWDISPLSFETARQDPYYFDVRIKDYTRKEGKCSANNRMAGATVPIEKKLLDEGKIKILRLTIGNTTDRYNVDYTNNVMRILPSSQVKFTSAAEMVHNFAKSSKKTGALLALIIPIAPAGTDTKQPLADYAQMNGLTPAPENATSSLPHTNGGSQIHYYYDARNVLSARLGSEFSPIGSTTIPVTYDLQDGRGQEFMTAPVYAKEIE